MAGRSLAGKIQDELLCSICLDYFVVPVTIHCGHNFCQACISQFWAESDANFSCPECRRTAQQESFMPNRTLERMAELAQQLYSKEAKGAAGGKRVCEKHKEPLKLFCENHQATICVVCKESRDHQGHTMIPVEEAAQEYKERIQAQLQPLVEEREKLLQFKLIGEKSTQVYVAKAEGKRQAMASEFAQLYQILTEQEQLHLAQMHELENEILNMQEENDTQLAKDIFRLNALIKEMEGKCQQPASEFLQDTERTLNRWKEWEFQQHVDIALELEKRVYEFSPNFSAVKATLRNIRGTLVFKPPEATKVTLDPATAHPQLILSENRKSVSWGKAWQLLPKNPERFDTIDCVLGCEGFASGKHFWEVEVEDKGAWAVGIARGSVMRKGHVSPSPKGGIWAVERWWRGEYIALTSPDWTPLFLGSAPRRVQVYLNYEWGQVTFSDADTNVLIFTFPLSSFTGEKVYPWFRVGEGTQLSLCS
uniref:Zinc finger protein RFP-like n=1 Tax=Crocodylus porosus TaxID=8502 RepID=A0A7M4F568_CROPO